MNGSHDIDITLVAPASRRARKKARTRDEIFDAAMALFVARGFDGVTIDDICRAADVARGTFFLHFPTKDALLGEYGARASAELATLLRRHRGGAPAALRLALAFLAERATGHAEMIQLMAREIMVRPAEQSRDLVQLLAGVVRRGQAAGELRGGVDPTIAAAVVVAAYLAIAWEWARQGAARDLRGLVRKAVDVVLRGLVPVAPRERS